MAGIQIKIIMLTPVFFPNLHLLLFKIHHKNRQKHVFDFWKISGFDYTHTIILDTIKHNIGPSSTCRWNLHVISHSAPRSVEKISKSSPLVRFQYLDKNTVFVVLHPCIIKLELVYSKHQVRALSFIWDGAEI